MTGGPSTAAPAWSVAEALAHARVMGVERLDAQRLLARGLACSRSWLVAHDDAVLDADQTVQLQAALARRVAGEPLAYLLGEQEFHGLTLSVTAAVLVPRADTEVLVDWALELLADEFASVERPDVIDLGTGSGAIALAVKNRQPRVSVVGTDDSASALAVARSNALHLGLDVSFLPGSWWSAVPARRFHLGLGNPPYIAAGDPHLAALRHEPQRALTPGGDGLDALRRIVRGAAPHLLPGGWLLLEHGHDQADAVRGLLREQGFDAAQTRRDLGGQARCTGASRQVG